MQVEPPGPDVPDRRPPDEAQEPVGALRLSAAAAAAVLALASAGHLLVLGALGALVARSRAGAVAVLLAVCAATVRWGGPSLSALGGDQAVLGPALAVGSAAAAASAVLAGLAVALAAPRALPLAAALGVVAGALVAGPALPHDVAVRVAGVVGGVALATAARWVPFRGTAAAAAGATALLLAAIA